MTADTGAAGARQDTGNGSAHVEAHEQRCDRLAALNLSAYTAMREAEAKRLGMTRTDLDDLRKEGKTRAKKAKADKETAEKAEKKNRKPSAQIDHDGYISFGPYLSSNAGLLFDHEADADGEKKSPTRICGPIKVLAKTENGAGIDWGKLLQWSDKAEFSHSWAMPMQMLAGDLTDIKRRFLNEGMTIATGPRNADRFANYLMEVDPEQRAQCVTVAGWCNGSFVTPAKVYAPDGAGLVVFQSDGVNELTEIRGTLAEWQEHIGTPAIGNARLQFAICTALAGPLLHMTDEESGGFHITGTSSIGKTSILHAASSVCGAPVRTWRATDNASESWAAESNDGLLILDELSQVDAKPADAMAYMLANGQGKGRANRSGIARRVAKWRTIILSSGEIGMAEKLNEGGKRHKAGQAARIVEFPADAGAALGAFQSLPEGKDARQFAEHIKEAAAKYRGTALDAFLTELVGDLDIADAARAMKSAWRTKHVAAKSDGQVQRIAGRFAIVAAAGELAISFGILPWPIGSASAAAKECFDAAVANRGGIGALEIERGIDQVRAFIAANGSSRFENPKDYEPREYQTLNGDTMKREAHPPKTVMRAGWREPDGDDWDYFVTAPCWRNEVCAGFNPKTIAQELRDRNLLRIDTDARLTRQKRFPGHGSVKVYHVLGRILADDEPANG